MRGVRGEVRRQLTLNSVHGLDVIRNKDLLHCPHAYKPLNVDFESASIRTNPGCIHRAPLIIVTARMRVPTLACAPEIAV